MEDGASWWVRGSLGAVDEELESLPALNLWGYIFVFQNGDESELMWGRTLRDESHFLQGQTVSFATHMDLMNKPQVMGRIVP